MIFECTGLAILFTLVLQVLGPTKANNYTYPSEIVCNAEQ